MSRNAETVFDIPILRVGGDLTVGDLDNMVESFGKLDFLPQVALGPPTEGAPSFGVIRALRRKAEQLFADIETTHPSVADALRGRLFTRLATEVYSGLKRGGRSFARALRAIRLDGVPAPDLALVPTGVIAFTADATEMRTYEFIESAGEEVDRRVREYRQEHKGKDGATVDYETAATVVLKADPDLAKRYESPSGLDTPFVSNMNPVGRQVDEAARRWIMAYPGTSYEDAMLAALDADPALRASYLNFPAEQR